MKKLLLTLIIGMFLISCVSAWEIDNKVIPSEDGKEMLIKNVFGFGDDIAKLTLKTDYHFTESQGYLCNPSDCYLEMELEVYDKGINLESYKGSKYYNKEQTRELIGKEKKYEIWDEDASYEEQIYKQVCSTFGNETTCESVKGKIITHYGKWVKYKSHYTKDVGVYRIREKVDIQSGETLDLVPNFYGKEIKEWVDFTGSTLYEMNNGADGGDNWGFNVYQDYFQFGTRFYVGGEGTNESFTLTGIAVKIWKLGSPTNEIIGVYEHNESFYPTIAIDTGTITSGDIGASTGAWYNVTMSGGAILNQGQSYLIMINGTGQPDSSNYYNIRRGVGGAYAGSNGKLCRHTTATSYVADSNLNALFEVWGTAIPSYENISIIYPTNTTYTNAIISELNYSVSSGGTDCWYSTDGGTTNNSVVCGNNVTGLSVNVGSNTWMVSVNNSDNQINDSYVSFVVNNLASNVSLLYPTNTSYDFVQTELNYSVSSGGTDCWYSTDGGTTNNSVVCGNNVTGLNSGEGSSTWLIGTNTTYNVKNMSVVTFFVDSIPPDIEMVYPLTEVTYHILSTNLTINWTVSDTNLVNCWWSMNNGLSNTSITCGENLSINITSVNNNTFTAWGNDSLLNVNSSTSNWNYNILKNSQSHNTTTYESKYENFIINTTYDNNFTISAYLVYNSTSYLGTKAGTGSEAIFTKQISAPLVSTITNKTFYWDIRLTNATGTYYYNSTSYNQTVNPIYFKLCNTTLNTSYINFTFKDEGDLSDITASIPTSTFDYWLDDISLNQTFTLINNTLNPNYAFCFSPIDKSLNVDIYMQYKNITSYPQRIYDPETLILTNNTLNKTLYLLDTADGIYVTFQVVNSAGQTLSGVDLNATRTIDSSTEVVGTGLTGDTGSVTFWLNPDFSHTFTFVKSGYDTYTTTYPPTQSSYTITLSGGTTTTSTSHYKGITTSINPTDSSLLNNTDYTFSFQLNSSFWDTSDYGFNLRLRNGSIITGGNTGVEGTILSKVYNTENQTRIYFDYYWVINSTYTNGSLYWNVYSTEYTQWSIATFFTDLTLYIDSGMFGLDDFGKNLIIFLILFITIGTLSYKYGVSSPIFLSSVIFGVIFFFDVAIGLIPPFEMMTSGREIEHFYTFISGLILTTLILREVSR